MLRGKPGADYPIKVHISALHYREAYVGEGQNAEMIYADAVVDGKKVELEGGQGTPFLSKRYKLELEIIKHDS